MPTARKHVVIPGKPGFYHCISRCVRRAFLCGDDFVTGRNFDHRRKWLLDRMCLMTTCFAIDIYAYAFMKNHYHIVFYVDPERVDGWTDDEVIEKWKTLWKWRQPERPMILPKKVSRSDLAEWRRRLADVSWVMRLLNEPLARIANAEDGAKGHFWESRFKCNPLLDDGALIACMVYTDLNPIKAGVAKTAAESDFTSIQQRIEDLHGGESENPALSDQPDSHQPKFKAIALSPVAGSIGVQSSVPAISSREYIALVNATAIELQQKCLLVSEDVLKSLGIKPPAWINSMNDILKVFHTAIGSDASFRKFMMVTKRVRRQNVAARKLLFT